MEKRKELLAKRRERKQSMKARQLVRNQHARVVLKKKSQKGT